jgi:hypothetical protein
MALSIIERIRRSRRSMVEAGGFEFTISRPTDMDMLEIGSKMTQALMLERFVVDWSGVREVDLVPGGGPEVVPFSTPLLCEWIADRPDLWNPISDAIISGYRAHEADLEARAKNSTPG